MVGHHDDVSIGVKIIGFQVIHDLPEVIIGIANGGARRGTIDAGKQLVRAITLVVLRAVRIARPVEDKKRFQLFLERRQDSLRHHVGEILLLGQVGGQCPGTSIVAAQAERLAIATVGRGGGQARTAHFVFNTPGQRDSFRSGGIVNDGDGRGLQCVVHQLDLGSILDGYRSQLAHNGDRISVIAGQSRQGHLTQIVTVVKLIQPGQNLIVLNERSECSAMTAGGNCMTYIQSVAEVSCIAQQMSGGKRRGIGGGEGRVERMAVDEIHALLAQLEHNRGNIGSHGIMAQSVSDEQNHVARTRRPGGQPP